MNQLWIAGKNVAEISVLIGWELCGIFDSEDKAIAACTSERHFIAPIKLNQLAPEGEVELPGCLYPLLGAGAA